LNIEYLRYSFDFKKDGAKRHQQIFNLQSSIVNIQFRLCRVGDIVFNRIKNLTKYNFIFLTGSTRLREKASPWQAGWTGYSRTKQKKILVILRAPA